MGALETAGVGVAAAALLTAVPVLWLTAVADNGADGLVHALAVASDLTDVLLFAAIATWATAALLVAEPIWFKALAGAVGLLALARALLLLAGSELLKLVAPLAFIMLVSVLEHTPAGPSVSVGPPLTPGRDDAVQGLTLSRSRQGDQWTWPRPLRTAGRARPAPDRPNGVLPRSAW